LSHPLLDRTEYAYPDEEGFDDDEDEDEDVEEHDRPANWGQDEVTAIFCEYVEQYLNSSPKLLH
jgi:hypothetical protein